MDRLDAARASQLEVLAVLELNVLEDLQTAGSELGLEIGRIAQPVRVDAAHVDAGRRGGDLAALEQHDTAAVAGQVKRGRHAGDAAANDENLRFGRRSHDAAYPAMR